MGNIYTQRELTCDKERIAKAIADGKNKSLYPSWHPQHCCGIFCDGQDGGNSDCSKEKRRGPPEWWKGVPVQTVSEAKVEEKIVVGSHIDGFVVNKIIHEGTWGNVYKVQPRAINQVYALKMATSEESQRRLYTERDILDKIGNHKNITKIYFAGIRSGDEPEPEKGHFYYIVEEYADTNLRKKLNDWSTSAFHNLSFETCIDILKQILEGLKYAHSKSIIHQDLKPENILLSATSSKEGVWDVQLCDFGLAALPEDDEKLQSSMDDTRAIAGSLHYLSPEQRSGKKADKRSDLYNVGLILYEMLTNKRPTINLVKPTEVREKLLKSNRYSEFSFNVPKPLPAWIDTFVLKALSAEPADRFQTADSMLEFIEKEMSPAEEEQVAVLPPLESIFWRLSISALCAVGAGIRKTGKGLWWLTKTAALSPFYLAFAPFVFFWKVIDSRTVDRNGLQFPLILLTVVWAAVWYFVAMPYGFQLNLEHQLAQSPPAGTILYYRSNPTAEHPRGFYFVRGDKLPEVVGFRIETLEIGEPEPNQPHFSPKHALSSDGKTFYYTTPNSLVRIKLDVFKNSPEYRKVLVQSEVFSYFSQLSYIDADPGFKGLYAKLKNETWHITEEGLLQQIHASITLPDYTRKVNNDYYVDGHTVEFNSYLLGNMSIGPNSQGAAVWYPELLQPKFGWAGK